jgi:hypothetical protein
LDYFQFPLPISQSGKEDWAGGLGTGP